MLLNLFCKRTVRKSFLQQSKDRLYPCRCGEQCRTKYAVNSRKTVTAMIKQSIYKSTVIISCGRMHHHSLWLIHNKQVFIFINYIKRNIFRFSLIRRRIGNIYNNNITLRKLVLFETTESFTSTAPFSIRLTAAERDKSIFASEINLSSLTPLVSQFSLNSFIAFVDLFSDFITLEKNRT